MRRSLSVIVVGVLGLLLGGSSARARVIAPAPIPQRVATADVVVVGTVSKIEDKTVKAARYPGDKTGGEYKVAVVKIAKGLLGAKGLTHIHVGFIPRTVGRGGPIGRGRPSLSTNLTAGMEVCLFLKRHPDATFYYGPMYYDVVKKEGTPQFAKNVELAQRSAEALADPMASLKSRDATRRFLAAGMLVYRYRTVPNTGKPTTTEPIPAEESKLILTALAEADWEKPDPVLGYQFTPMNLFYRMGITEKDGFVRPKVFREVPAAARKWITENAGTYRIQRFVEKKG